MCKCVRVCACVGGGHFSRYPTHKCKLRLSASAELGHLAFMGLSFFFFLLVKPCFVVFFLTLRLQNLYLSITAFIWKPKKVNIWFNVLLMLPVGCWTQLQAGEHL